MKLATAIKNEEEFHKGVKELWYNVLVPYIHSNNNRVLTKLTEDDLEEFISFMELNSSVYKDDIYHELHDPNVFDDD